MIKKFNYPNDLQTLFDKLNANNIKALIIGGYVRDFFLNLESKDIDIELYHAVSLTQVIKILENFGDVNCVGKSFAVIKLSYKGYELDFSLPRKDNKTDKGHKGFVITVDNSLSFEEASRRRDFTINAMAYDVMEQKLLDPHNGLTDLKKKILRAVDLETFSQDPLRILRGVGFASRFLFSIEKNLFTLMHTMVEEKALDELPKERVFEEIKKILLKSKKPSSAFLLLQQLNVESFGFSLLFSIEQEKFIKTLDSLDTFAKLKNSSKNSEEIVIIMLALLVQNIQDPEKFLFYLTENKKLLKAVLQLHSITFDLDKMDDYAIYKLATKINIRIYTLYLKALYKNKKEIEVLEKRAQELGVYENALKPLVRGSDLIEKGYRPSADFQKILQKLYEKQLQNKITKKDDLLSFV
jgi:tRNA nucleotidyltransferase (CCA-adding enzyme)